MRRPGELSSIAVPVTTPESRTSLDEVVPAKPWQAPSAATPASKWPHVLSPGRITATAVLLALLPYLYDLTRFAIDANQRVAIWGDDALEALATRDVWRGHQLLGPFSRYGWHHPGPALFYWLAIPDRIMGSNGPGIVFGTLLLNAVAAGAVVIVLGRRGGPWLAMWAAGCLSLLHLALGGYLWRDFWNPYAVLLPMVLLVVLAADAATGAGASWCWALVVGSFAVQTHISTAPSVIVMVAAGLVGLLWARHRHRNIGGFTSPPAIAGLAVAALLWVPPLTDAVRHHPSNLSQMVKFFTTPHPVHSLGEAGRTSLSAATVVFFGRHGPISAVVVRSIPALAAGAIAFAVLAGATLAIGRRRGHRLGPWLAVVSALGFAAAIVGGTRVVGDISQYLTIWQAYLPITLLLGLGAALLGDRLPPGDRVAPAVQVPGPAGRRSSLALGASIIAVAGALTGAALTMSQTAALAGPARFPGYSAPAEVAQASQLISGALRPSNRVVRLTIATQSAWPTVAGVALELERSGKRTTEVGTPGSGVDAGLLFGASRRPTGHEDVDIEFQRQGAGEVQGAAPHGTPLGVLGTLSVLINRTAP